MEYKYPYEHDQSDFDTPITGNPWEAFQQLRSRMRLIFRGYPYLLKLVLENINE